MTIKEIIVRLVELGFTQKDIADFAGTTQPTINRAAKGAAIRYEYGKRIEEMLQNAMAKQKRAKKEAIDPPKTAA